MSIHYKLVTPSLYDLETVMKQKKNNDKNDEKNYLGYITLSSIRKKGNEE